MISVAQRPQMALPREIWVLISANAMVALGYGVVSPVLPAYARTFGVSIGAATFVITVFSLSRLCFAPVSGLLVQRLGEQRIYVTGLLIVSVSTGACAFTQTYWQFLLLRAVGGIGSTMFFVSALGLMIRISPADARGRIAGLFATSFLAGSACGPLIGSLTAGLGLGAPFFIYGIAVSMAAVVVFFSMRRSVLAGPIDKVHAAVTLRAALRHRAYRSALLSNFATGWSVFGLRIALVPLFVVEVLGRGPRMTGLALATFSIGNVCSVLPSGYLSDRIGRRSLLIAGLAVSGVATMWVGASSSVALFLVMAYVAGAASGIFTSPQQAAVADILGSTARAGTAVAAFQMMVDLGAIVGSAAVGQIAEHLSFGWGFVISGAILLVAAVGWMFAPETRVAVEPVLPGPWEAPEVA